MFKYFLIAVIFLGYSSSASATFWRACNETLRTVDYISSPLCDEHRCFAVRGQDFIANITISSPDVHYELISENIVFIMGVGVPLPMEYPHDNGCNVLERDGQFVGCPTVPHLPHHWNIKQPILQNLPAFQNALVRYILHDRGTIAGCVEFFATLV